ncbi:hypothetical protein AMECASPLE_039458 [Ameca splendens]|uniref:Protein FAR1-RELATED SEQUENCE n=1 Tax=Ameca splendens TaxID=208324 RepID=A0ABV0YVI9_9TELE
MGSSLLPPIPNGAFTRNTDSANISRHFCAFARLTFHVNSALPNVAVKQEELPSAACWFQLKMADMDFTAFYLWRAEKRRRRLWVQQILQGREQFGDYHHLLQELRLDDGRFQRYFRLSRTQFEDLLSCVGRRIRLRDTNYRRCIPAAERLSICLR